MLTVEHRRAPARSPRSSRIWAPAGPIGDKATSGSPPKPDRASNLATEFGLPLTGEIPFSQEFIDALVSEVAVLDPQGQIVIASKNWRARSDRAQLASGRDQAEAGSDLDFLSSDRSTARLIARKIASLLAGELDEAELNFTSHDGSTGRRNRLRAAALGHGEILGVVVVNEDVTENYELHRDKQLLTEQLMRSEETERRRIAREMHDSTVQDLVAIGLNLKRLRHLAEDEVAQEVLAEVRTILKRTQRDVRTLSYLLHPPLLEEGGLSLALSSLICGLSGRMKIRVEFECNVPDSANIRLPIDVEMALYRVAQEALINVHKHASATHALVTYHRDPDRIVLMVEDDGIGIGGKNAQHVGSGVGIQGMRARLQQLGGVLTLSTLKHGTRLKAVIPIGDPVFA